MKKVKSLEKLAEDYAEGIDKNVEVYREHAEESAPTFARHFAPFYARQIASSLATENLKGYDRLVAYSMLMKMSSAGAKEDLRRIIEEEAKSENINIPTKTIPKEKIEKAVKLVIA